MQKGLLRDFYRKLDMGDVKSLTGILRDSPDIKNELLHKESFLQTTPESALDYILETYNTDIPLHRNMAREKLILATLIFPEYTPFFHKLGEIEFTECRFKKAAGAFARVWEDSAYRSLEVSLLYAKSLMAMEKYVDAFWYLQWGIPDPNSYYYAGWVCYFMESRAEKILDYMNNGLLILLYSYGINEEMVHSYRDLAEWAIPELEEKAQRTHVPSKRVRLLRILFDSILVLYTVSNQEGYYLQKAEEILSLFAHGDDPLYKKSIVLLNKHLEYTISNYEKYLAYIGMSYESDGNGE